MLERFQPAASPNTRPPVNGGTLRNQALATILVLAALAPASATAASSNGETCVSDGPTDVVASTVAKGALQLKLRLKAGHAVPTVPGTTVYYNYHFNSVLERMVYDRTENPVKATIALENGDCDDQMYRLDTTDGRRTFQALPDQYATASNEFAPSEQGADEAFLFGVIHLGGKVPTMPVHYYTGDKIVTTAKMPVAYTVHNASFTRPQRIPAQ